MKGHLAEMMTRHGGRGQLRWIGLRPARRAALLPVEHATITESGLAGDHAPVGKKAITLLQHEHLAVIAALAGLNVVGPDQLRRNLVVSGINLAAFRKSPLQIGHAIVLIEGPCPPCSRMEEVLGHGGYNAMRGHGGWYASVLSPADIQTGDAVLPA